MTALGLLVIVSGVGLVWAGVTDANPLDELRRAFGGNVPTAKPRDNATSSGTSYGVPSSGNAPGAGQ